MKKAKEARVLYNKEWDSFDIEIRTENGWELDASYHCFARAGDDENRTNYIHFGILRKIADLKNMGYKIDLLR